MTKDEKTGGIKMIICEKANDEFCSVNMLKNLQDCNARWNWCFTASYWSCCKEFEARVCFT